MVARIASLPSISGRLKVALSVAVRIAAGGDAVAGVDVALGDIELRLVRDVADHAGLRAAAEQRALRALEDFDALHVDEIDVGVAAGNCID